MSVINDLILSMSSSDKEYFVLYLQQRSKRKEGRNIELFQKLTSGQEALLKESIGTNAYNVLKMRLTDSLIDFLSGRVFENELSTESNIIRKIALARKMIQLDNIQTGKKILVQAEKKAFAIQHFTLLNEIYHSLIEISHLDQTEDQDELIKKLETNTKHFLHQERLNLVYAQIRSIVNASEQGGQRFNLSELIETSFQKYGISDEKGFGLKSLYQLAMLLDYAGAQSRNYHNVDLFLIEKMNLISEDESNIERNHLYHIDLYYSIANIYFRKRSFEHSCVYLEKMMAQMHRFDKKFMNERYVKHQLLLALNLNFSNNTAEALSLLENLSGQNKDSQEGLQAYLTHIVVLAQQENYKESNSLMQRLYRSDTYYKRIAGLEWVINRRFIEIILQIELNQIDLAVSRIESLTRQYKEFFSAKENTQAKPFLRIIKHYLNNPAAVTSESFQQRVERTIPWEESSKEDIFFISFYAWIKAKMISQPLYQTTLELIRSSE